MWNDSDAQIWLFYLFLAALDLCCCTCCFFGLWPVGVTLQLWYALSHCGCFSCCGAKALGIWASVVTAGRLSSCNSGILEFRLSSCGSGYELLPSMWDLPRPGIETVSPALAGGFLTTGPPRKSKSSYL